ncbi:MAG: tetratricopeptide repeat protein [Cyclobacteriaceae bacterium]
MILWKFLYQFALEHIFCTFALIVLSPNLLAQNSQTDSLVQLLKQPSLEDTTRIRLTLAVADQLFSSEPQQAIELLNSIKLIIYQASRGQQADHLHYYGAAYHSLGNIDSVAYYHELILSRITKEDDDRRYARALANLATAYRIRGELNEAAQRYEEALEIFEIRADTFPRGTIRNSLGLVYDAQGDYQSAMQVYLEALDIFESVNHKGAQAIVLNNIGRVYQAQQDHARAIAYYQQYKDISDQVEHHSGVANALNNIGSAFSEINELDSAEYYLLESVRVKEEIGMIINLAASLNNLGKVANLKADYPLAIHYNERALALSREHKNKKDESFSLLELARSYEQLKNYTTSQSYYQQALALAEEMGDITLRHQTHEGLYRVHKPQEPDRAMSYLEKAYVLKDSILNAENVEAITTLRLENAFTKKELIHQQKITTLELQEALQTARLSNQRIAIAGLVVVLLVLGILLYQVFSQKNKIQHQNRVIHQALKDKDTLLREIHHRVKNNLQVISSLLSIQSRNVTDQVAADALNEGRSRVQTMSLIHQDLYQHDNLSGIAIRTYFEKLIRNLFDTYNLSSEQIIVEAHIEDLTLDVDTVIPLGLVINELVSNALKYAFPTGKGRIEVILKEQSNRLCLTISDNGVGMKNPQTVMDGHSYGYELIQALVDKLEGELEISNHQGTQVLAVFKDYQKAA